MPFCHRHTGVSQLHALSRIASKHFSVDDMPLSNIAAIVTAAIPLSQTAADERSDRLKGQRTFPARRCLGTCPRTLSPGSPSFPGCPEPLRSSYSSNLQPEKSLVRHSMTHLMQLSSQVPSRGCASDPGYPKPLQSSDSFGQQPGENFSTSTRVACIQQCSLSGMPVL